MIQIHECVKFKKFKIWPSHGYIKKIIWTCGDNEILKKHVTETT